MRRRERKLSCEVPRLTCLEAAGGLVRVFAKGRIHTIAIGSTHAVSR
jgi:hypothetical protein